MRFLDATEIALTVLYPNEGLNIGLQRDRRLGGRFGAGLSTTGCIMIS
jgi:hypothetical protein